VPGDPEREMEQDTRLNGIPLLDPVVNDLQQLASKFNLLFPAQRI
jgi:LDH2 family malate/lactate/ureidoglycolate dehydrogenase